MTKSCIWMCLKSLVKINDYLIKLPLECRNLFLIGESDVQSRRYGIDELDPMLLSSTN